MGVLYNKKETQLFLTCKCGCEEGIHFRIDKEDPDLYFMGMVLNGNFYTEQGENIFSIWKKKIRKIWAILRNKDFYYSEIFMNKKEFEEFKSWISGID